VNPTPSQNRAIEHAGRNLQLIACAGSGKTEVVARRVVHLLTPGRTDSLSPRNIVAFAFTDKAAAELKERIVTYQWRGSDVQNILTFAQRYPEVERISLEENFRSSDGIVETARAFIEQNSARLPKTMKPTGAQPYEAEDIVALSFPSAADEARYIAATAQALRGVAFREDGKERGLSWSDMAILLRSVRASAEPITEALRAAGIPFVVTGMTNLFGTSEAEAARQLFYFVAERPGVSETAVIPVPPFGWGRESLDGSGRGGRAAHAGDRAHPAPSGRGAGGYPADGQRLAEGNRGRQARGGRRAARGGPGPGRGLAALQGGKRDRREDRRWKFGVPPVDNANFAWVSPP
jgi:superfamily I DNA/RNA helicase